MGFRFRQSIKILPGIRINVSKSGVSTSIGKPGATVNLSDRGVRGTVGLPGTGISYSEKLAASDAGGGGTGIVVLAVLLIVLVAMLAL